MRRFPVVKSEVIKASVGPSKRAGSIVHSVMLLVIGVAIGAVCVLVFIGGPMVPTKSGPAQRQPTRGEGHPVVVPDPLTANDTKPVEKSYNATIVQDRSIPSLLLLLSSNLGEQREEAAYALELACEDYPCLEEIVLAGGIPILRGIVDNATEANEGVLSKVIGLLSSFITSGQLVNTELIRDGYVRRFIALAQDGADDVKEAAVNALLSTSSYLKEPAYNETLSTVTHLVWNGTPGVVDAAARWLANRCLNSNGKAVEPEVIPALVQVLRVGSDEAKMLAAMALARTPFGNVRRTIVESGGVPLLVPLLAVRGIRRDVARALLVFTTEYPETLAQVALVGLPLLQRIVEQGPGMYVEESLFVGNTYKLCVNLARNPAVAAQMVQAGMLPLWVRLSQEGEGEVKRQARRVVTFLSRVTAAQDQPPPPNTPSIRRRDP
jgi:hypothetical protein